LATRQLFTAR